MKLVTARTRTRVKAIIAMAAFATAVVTLTPVGAGAAEPWLDENFSGWMHNTFDGGSGLIATSGCVPLPPPLKGGLTRMENTPQPVGDGRTN